jgi:hypothetical protein
LAGDDGDSHWLRLFLFCRVKVLADLSDGSDVSNPAADCGNGFAHGFNGSSGNFANCLFDSGNCRTYIWQSGL